MPARANAFRGGIEVRKVALTTALVLGVAVFGLAQYSPRLELSFHYGGISRDLDVAGGYNYDWTGSLYALDQLGSFSRFHITADEGGDGLRGGLSLFFTPSLGVGFTAGYFRTSAVAMSESSMWWSWVDSGTYFAYDSVLDEPLWMGADGDLRTIPLSLDLIVRFGAKRFQGFFSGGPTLSINRFFIDSEIVYALAYTAWIGFYYQAVDVIRVPMKIDQRWTSFGFNIGGGFIFWAFRALGLVCDLRYFSYGPKWFDWELVTGEYDGLFGNLIYDFGQSDIDAIRAEGRIKPPVSIDPSFLQINIGVKIRLW
jgi:hypothetical protein